MLTKHQCSLLILCLSICVVTSRKDENNLVELVITNLKDTHWIEEESQCVQDTLYVLNNVKNYTVWAVWIWNSMQYPSGTFYGSKYSLGNYDQCLNAPAQQNERPLNTQYCLADLKLAEEIKNDGGNPYVIGTIHSHLGIQEHFQNPDMDNNTEEFLSIPTKMARKQSVLTWGTCLPASCKRSSVSKIIEVIYKLNPISPMDPEVNVTYCKVAGTSRQFDFKFYTFITLIATLITIAILSTIYCIYNETDTALSRIASSFDMKRNWTSFVTVSKDEISILSWIKSFQVFFTTIIHVFLFNSQAPVINAVYFDYSISVIDDPFGKIYQHADMLSIENFIVISGLLLMYGFLEKKRNPIISLVQRYIRLVGSYSLLVFYIIAVARYTGDGPIWDEKMGIEEQACKDNWLISLLMLNNYVNTENICQVVTWYIPCDFHLAIMGTILYLIWQKSPRIGKIISVAIFLTTAIGQGVVIYKNRLPGLFTNYVLAMEFRKNVGLITVYMKSHYRAANYLVGMAMGYVLFKYKPAKYQRIISKGWSFMGLAIAIIVGYTVLTAAPAWCLGEYNPWYTTIYVSTNTVIWDLMTCLSIAIHAYGDLPYLRDFISWPGFVIFGRMAYGIYITHSVFLQMKIFSVRSPMYYKFLDWSIYGLGILIMSAILAIGLWIFVEAPISNLTNLVLLPRNKRTSHKTINEDAKSINTESITCTNKKEI